MVVLVKAVMKFPTGHSKKPPLQALCLGSLLLQNREDAALLMAYHFLHNLQVQGALEKEMQALEAEGIDDDEGLDSITRDLVVVICNMMFGAGKSRLGEELRRLFKKLKEMGPEGLAAQGCPTITDFVGIEDLEMLSSMKRISVNYKTSPPRADRGISVQQALAKSILKDDNEYCKFQEWIKERKTQSRDPTGSGKTCKYLSSSLYLQNQICDNLISSLHTPPPNNNNKNPDELMLLLGRYIKDVHKDRLVMIHLDEVGELLVKSYPEYKEVENQCDDKFKRHVKRAWVLWNCLLRLLLKRGVLLYLSGKDTAFHSLGKKRLGPSYKSPSAWHIIPLNPLNKDQLWAILQQIDGKSFLLLLFTPQSHGTDMTDHLQDLKELGWEQEKKTWTSKATSLTGSMSEHQAYHC